MEVAKGARSTGESIETEACPGAEWGDPTYVELIAKAPELLGVRLFLGRTDEGGDRHLVTPGKMTDHVERTDLPPARRRVGHSVAKEEDLHTRWNGAPRVP